MGKVVEGCQGKENSRRKGTVAQFVILKAATFWETFQKVFRRVALMTFLPVALVIVLAGCGRGGQQGTGAGAAGAGAGAEAGAGEGEWFYEPEYLELEIPENTFAIRQEGNFLYYPWEERNDENMIVCSGLTRISLLDGSEDRMAFRVEGGSIWNYNVKEDGTVYAYVSFYGEDGGGRYLVKYDVSGEEVYRTELEHILEEIEYFAAMEADSRGRVYLAAGDGKVLLFDEKGQLRGDVTAGDRDSTRVLALHEGRDGKMYVSMIGFSSSLTEIDFENRSAGALYKGFPGESGNYLSPGLQKDFLLYDNTTLYEYDLAENAVEEVLAWKDYAIDNSLVRFVGVTEDGRVMALLNDWTTNDYSVALMKRTSEAEAVPLKKETVTLAAFSANPALHKAVQDFNKKYPQYYVTVEEYYEPGMDMEQVRERMNAELVSGKGPDIVGLDLFEEDSLETLSGSGVFEDLGPYLEQSEVLAREDFVEGVIESGIYGERLITIPRTFAVYALACPAAEVGAGIGKDAQAEVGAGAGSNAQSEADAGAGSNAQARTDAGFRLEELYALAEQHPDKSVFLYPGRELYYCMRCNQDAFVDREAGKCSFDSPEFVRMLEFAKQMHGLEYDQGMNKWELVRSGDARIVPAYFERFEEAQYYEELFGENIVFVGYPTVDGSVCFPMVTNNRYAIVSGSQKKAAAWKFLEEYLTMGTTKYETGFLTLKKELEQEFERVATVTYLLDKDGEPVLDENGDPIVENSYSASVTDGSGWTYYYRATTREEAELVREIIGQAEPVPGFNQKIESIIEEEAEFYYNNAKSAEEVAKVIQRRVQLYIEENR